MGDGWQTVFHQTTSIQPLSFWLQPVTLPGSVTEAHFAFAWDQPALTYTSASNPSPTEVGITLVQPPGIVLHSPPANLSPGACLFDLTAPRTGPGLWYLQVIYPGQNASAPALGVRADVAVTLAPSAQAGWTGTTPCE